MIHSPEVEAAILTVSRMSRSDFLAAARELGLAAERKSSPPRERKTALIQVISNGTTFAVRCGWCGWETEKAHSFHSSHEIARNHNRNDHRDHCIVRTVDAA